MDTTNGQDLRHHVAVNYCIGRKETVCGRPVMTRTTPARRRTIGWVRKTDRGWEAREEVYSDHDGWTVETMAVGRTSLIAAAFLVVLHEERGRASYHRWTTGEDLPAGA